MARLVVKTKTMFLLPLTLLPLLLVILMGINRRLEIILINGGFMPAPCGIAFLPY